MTCSGWSPYLVHSHFQNCWQAVQHSSNFLLCWLGTDLHMAINGRCCRWTLAVAVAHFSSTCLICIRACVCLTLLSRRCLNMPKLRKTGDRRLCKQGKQGKQGLRWLRSGQLGETSCESILRSSSLSSLSIAPGIWFCRVKRPPRSSKQSHESLDSFNHPFNGLNTSADPRTINSSLHCDASREYIERIAKGSIHKLD